MAPVIFDSTSDFMAPVSVPAVERTLLLAPPSIASHEEKLRDVLATHDRTVSDLQMLDRLSAGLVTLPRSTYDVVLLLSDADGTRTESSRLLGRDVFTKIVDALKPGGKLQSQDKSFGQAKSIESVEAILAGLILHENGMEKPNDVATEAMPLKLSRKPKTVAAPAAAPVPSKPATVGFVDFGDDLDEVITGEDDDDDLIDEDTLLSEEDKTQTLAIPEACIPKVGKRRRACKDCTCGLAERLAAEDAAKRSTADAQLQTMKLQADDLTEMDFTVQGKVGSCGNCSLGDAFRCDGCPYIGLPPFKPGEEVRLLNNDIQL